MENQKLTINADSNSAETLARLLDGMALPELPVKPEDPNAPRWIMHSKIIDKHTTKRTRVLITPAVCTKCGFDAGKLAYEQNKIETAIYADMSPDLQEIMKQVIIRHKTIAHTDAEELIVTEKPKSWLGGRELGRT